MKNGRTTAVSQFRAKCDSLFWGVCIVLEGKSGKWKKTLALDIVRNSVLDPTLWNSQIVFDSLRFFSTEVARSQCTLSVKFREVK